MKNLMPRANFLHTHDHLRQSLGHDHVVVDRADCEEARRILLTHSDIEEARRAVSPRTFDFIVCFDCGTDLEAIIEPLHEAGCNDGTLASCGNRVWMRFSREANSLEDAIKSAVADVRNANCCTVTRVEIEV